MTLGKKIKKLTEEGFTVSFDMFGSETPQRSTMRIRCRRDNLVDAFYISDDELRKNNCGINKLLERALRAVERTHLDDHSCRDCKWFHTDDCPNSSLCYETYTKPYLVGKE